MKHHEYLTNVLDNWTEFCKSHDKFAQAIAAILDENKRLKAENEALKASFWSPQDESNHENP